MQTEGVNIDAHIKILDTVGFSSDSIHLAVLIADTTYIMTELVSMLRYVGSRLDKISLFQNACAFI